MNISLFESDSHARSAALRFRITAVAFLMLVAVRVFAQPGPRLTDEQVFEALNLDYPGLEQTKSNVLATHFTAAKASLTTYLKTRTNVSWFFDWHNPTTAVSYSRTQADAATNGTITQVGYTYTFPGSDIDWFYNYTTNLACGCAKNNEWQWQLNRMGWWANLGRTYWATRDENYALAWSRQLRDWIADCPVVASRANGSPSTWRTIESGIRMSGAWPDAFLRFMLSGSLTNEEHVLYLKSCIEHGRYLTNFYTSENFLTMEMNGLFTVGTIFPELKEATGWRSFAANKLYTEQTIQFLPDGVHNELTPRYHGVAVDNIANIHDLAATNNRLADIPTGYLTGLEKSFAFYAAIATPQRTTPAFNDSSRENVKSWLGTALVYFPNRPDFQWFASSGASGAPPAYLSYRFPCAGYGVMRSGWATNANYLCFDAGALGYSGHRHEDKLNVVLWANGREFLLDDGGGPYESSIWRTWAQSSYSHNTVVVDGLDQEGGDGSTSLADPDYVAQGPIDLRWESDLYHDFAAGVYNRGWGGNYNNRPAMHTRRVLFVKPDIFFIADTVAPTNTASHTYQARWHLRSTNTVLATDTQVVTTTDAGLPNLAIVPCLSAGLTITNVSAQTSASGLGATNLSDILGWDMPSTSSGAVAAAAVTHTLSGTGTQQFLTLFLPIAAGVTNPVTLVSNTGPTSAEVWLADGRRLQVSADPNPLRGLKLTEILSNGLTNRKVGAGFGPPVFTGMTNRLMNPDTIKVVTFCITDPDGSASNVVLTARSLNRGVVPDTGLALSGSSSNRVLTVTPPANVTGAARLVISATDPDGSIIATDFLLTVNSPPQTNGAVASTWEEQPVDIDLRGVLGDDLTPGENLLVAASNAVGGLVTLLPDGHTGRFTPATNFSGTGSVEVVCTDMGFDPRLLLHYHFEAPGNPGDGIVTDNSDNLRDAAVRTNGTGSAALDTDVPAALGIANLRSLRLFESASTNVACLARAVPTNEFNFNDHDWTFAGWFKRATQATEDFIFYIGDGDGFGANEELQLHGVANSPTLNLRHYIGETNTDVKLVTSGIATGEWHHATITFTRTNTFAGILTLYVDGALVGAGTVPHFNLPQTVPVIFGGHNRTNSKPERWFSGWLDDLAVFTVALSSDEIATLATRTIGHNAGLSSTNLVSVVVRNINDPPSAGTGATNTLANSNVTFDLRQLGSDPETPQSNLAFAVSNPVNGLVTLLADGHTARFTPMSNFTGMASFAYSVTDLGEDPRALVHYSFAPPESLSDSQVTDNTGQGRDGTLITLGAGSFSLSSLVPLAVAADVASSLTLNDQGTNGAARLQSALDTNEFDMSDSSWTVAGWINRFATTNDDFIFYIGNGDGFGGGGDEFQLYCPSGANTVRVRHYSTANTLDLDMVSGSGVAAGSWHHVALTFERTGPDTGLLRLYTNGMLTAISTNVTWALQQAKPLVFGGHNSSSKSERSWNGRLTDLVLLTNALNGSEISRLATRSAARFGGLSATNTVAVTVGAFNTAPTLAAISNRTINAGVMLVVTNLANDPEAPPQVLTFNLLNAPANASVNATSGVFRWRPLVAQANSSNWIAMQVSDNGTPSLSATQSFRVTVLPVSKPVLGSPDWSATRFALSVSGDAGLDYTIQASLDLADPGNWQTLLSTNSPLLPFSWADTNTSDFTQRFYRVLQGP